MKKTILSFVAAAILATGLSAKSFELQEDGWNLLGTSEDVVIGDYFADGIQSIWIFEQNFNQDYWKVWTTDSDYANKIKPLSRPATSQEVIKAGSGFWVNGKKGIYYDRKTVDIPPIPPMSM
jgi:hypothetical protein